jgi:hypothetical protein
MHVDSRAVIGGITMKQNAEVARLLAKPTITVREAGMKIFGLSRNASYGAAKRGDFHTIRMGKRILVPTAPLRRQLGIEAV